MRYMILLSDCAYDLRTCSLPPLWDKHSLCLLNKHFHFSEAILSKYLNFKHWASLSCYSDRDLMRGLSLAAFPHSSILVMLICNVCVQWRYYEAML
jgi:hypothetical protein